MIQAVVESIKYFDRPNGNTYFKIRILNLNQEIIYETDKKHYEYGYGEQYQARAREELVKLGILTPKWNWEEVREKIFFCQPLETTRQRDIKEW
jgi:hypothetical protein